MSKIWVQTFWRICDFFWGLLRFALHLILGVWYGCKGKTTVPFVTNPLLLKSATQLAKEIREGKLKSEDVVQAYVERIEEVEPYINATAHCLFEDALQEAKEVDSLIASGKYTEEELADEMPLLGVPFTVKLLLTVKGVPSTAGSRIYENVIATEDAPTVAMMRKSGAIVVATTNSPEFGFSTKTVNLVYGATNNPYDINRTPGGSSGGEGALIAAGGSILGLGNDYLGSIRIPTHLTGIFGHKPSKDLVPNEGMFPKLNPGVYKYICTGPMCRYAEDLVTSMKVLSSQSEVKMKLGQPVNLKKLKLLYLKEIISPCVTPVEAEIDVALKYAVSYFEVHQGLTSKQVEMPWLFDAFRCTMNMACRHLADFEDRIKDIKPFNIHLDCLKSLFGKSYLAFDTLCLLKIGYCPLLYRESQFSYYDKMAEKWIEKFDSLLDEDTVLFLPTLPYTASYHYEVIPLLPSLCYCSIFSILGLPSTHCPLGINKEGLPYGIQIVARRNNDALTIACAVELEKAFGGWKSPGGTGDFS